jgi:hypothetical protein
MKLLRKITRHLPILIVVALFTSAYISIKKNITKKNTIKFTNNKIIKRAVASKTTKSSPSKTSSLKKKKAKVIKKVSVSKIYIPKNVVKNVPKIKAKKVVTLKARSKDKRELAGSEAIKLYGFKVKTVKKVSWVAYFDDYSKKQDMIADKVNSQRAAPKKKVASIIERKKKPLKELIKIPKLTDLNLGYESVSLKQYIDEYKNDKAIKGKKKNHHKKISRKTPSVSVIKKPKVNTQKKAIKKMKKDREKIKRRIKEEAKREKDEKLASVTGSVRDPRGSVSKEEVTTQDSIGYSLNSQANLSNNKDLSSQGNYRAPAVITSIDLKKMIEENKDHYESTKPTPVEAKAQKKKDEVIVKEEIFKEENIEKKLEDEIQIAAQLDEFNDSSTEVEKHVESIDQIIAESKEVEEEVKEITKVERNQDENKAKTKTEQLDQIIVQMNKKFEASTTDDNKKEKKTIKPFENFKRNKSVKAPTQVVAQAQVATKQMDKEQILKMVQSAQVKAKEEVIERKVEVKHQALKPIRSALKINVESVELDKSSLKGHSNFDIRFNDNYDDVFSDHGSGSVIIRTKLNNRMAVRAGNIVSRGYLPTNIDFVFEPDNYEVDIPLIESSAFDRLVQKEGLQARGGHILIQLDADKVSEDVTIDKKYEAKFYLNNRFKVVDRDSDNFSYVLFIGVEPGNAFLSYLTRDRDTASKIIFVTESEVYFDTNEFIFKKLDEFDLVENHILASKNLELVLNQSEISILGTNKVPSKKGLSRYVYKGIKYPLGTRQYNELKHISDSIFVGRWNNKVVEVPSEEYVRFVMNKFSMDKIGSQCVIQLNVTKVPKKTWVTGKSNKGLMRIERKILDNDGLFYSSVSENTRKVFLVGEQQGIINAKVAYQDGSFDYIQTYCSEDTYLVEQL